MRGKPEAARRARPPLRNSSLPSWRDHWRRPQGCCKFHARRLAASYTSCSLRARTQSRRTMSQVPAFRFISRHHLRPKRVWYTESLMSVQPPSAISLPDQRHRVCRRACVCLFDVRLRIPRPILLCSSIANTALSHPDREWDSHRPYCTLDGVAAIILYSDLCFAIGAHKYAGVQFVRADLRLAL